jgi:hypothetical protein
MLEDILLGLKVFQRGGLRPYSSATPPLLVNSRKGGSEELYAKRRRFSKSPCVPILPYLLETNRDLLQSQNNYPNRRKMDRVRSLSECHEINCLKLEASTTASRLAEEC